MHAPKIFTWKYDKQQNKKIKILRSSKKLWVVRYLPTLHTVFCLSLLGTENTEDYTSVIIILCSEAQ